jgi:hypothetical protein
LKRTLRFCLATAFLFVCVGLLAFLHQFTVLEGNWTYLEWEQSSAVSADGTQRPFDPMAAEPALTLAVYLLLHRDKAFRKSLLRLTIWSLSVLTGCWTVSAMRQGYLFRYLKDQWAALLQTGYYGGLLYWLTALNTMYEGRNFDGIRRFLTELKGQNRQTSQVQFTQHFAINAMLTPKLSIPEENLCTLFMNLLGNALEAAGQAEKGNRFIHLRTYIRSGFLAVLCENGYNGCLSTDQDGRLRSTKPESEAHGFGLALMETIAKKYKSILDVSYTETVFTIQTALKLPTETEN